MPTQKIGDVAAPDLCRHPEHNPPTHMVWAPGVYLHTCPACGNRFKFTVLPGPTL